MDVPMDDSAQLPGARALGPRFEHSLDLRRRGAVAHACFMTGAGKRIGAKHGGDIDQRARHGCDRNAAEPCDDLSIEGTGSVRLHSLNASFRPGRHFGHRRLAPHQDLQMGSSHAAEHRAFPCGQDGGEVGRLSARRPVPNAIDTRVHAEQAAPLHSRPNLLRRHAGETELRTGHDSIRGTRDPIEFRFDGPVSGLHTNP
jgi:hypothetical protein